MAVTIHKIGAIKPNPTNPRVIKDHKFKQLVKSLQDFPDMAKVRPIVCNTDMVVLGGNMRLKAMKEAGWKEVPVEVVDWPEDKQREFIIKDNVGFGEWDWEMIANEWDTEQLTDWGLDIPEFKVEAEAVEDNYEIPDQVQTDIVFGDLFEIGPHRLLCGDSTNADDVARLMGGDKADMVFTDPPYGVNIKGGAKSNQTISGDITSTAIPFSFDLAVSKATKDDARFYFCGSEGNIGLYQKLFDRFLRRLPRHLIWVKNGFVMKPNNYHNQYEIIFFGFKDKGGSLDKWYGGRTEDEASDVWQIKRDPSASYLHPTQKPIELPSRAIKNSSKFGDLLFEPFTGSGSTMVAAHQLNRKCYGMELDPKYCQVIIDRMRKLDPALVIKKNGEVV